MVNPEIKPTSTGSISWMGRVPQRPMQSQRQSQSIGAMLGNTEVKPTSTGSIAGLGTAPAPPTVQVGPPPPGVQEPTGNTSTGSIAGLGTAPAPPTIQVGPPPPGVQEPTGNTSTGSIGWMSRAAGRSVTLQEQSGPIPEPPQGSQDGGWVVRREE